MRLRSRQDGTQLVGFSLPQEWRAVACNRLMMALAAQMVFIFARPGGLPEQLCREALAQGRAEFVIECECNRGLVEMGGRPPAMVAGPPISDYDKINR